MVQSAGHSGYPSTWNTPPKKSGVLFATPQSSQTKRIPAVATPVKPGMGYFVFSSPKNVASTSLLVDHTALKREGEERLRLEQQEKEEERRRREEEAAWQAEEEARQKRRQKYLEIQAEEARRGEEEWVRSGGILRDADGNRDYARTQAIRDELALREMEKQLTERWERYEQRWNRIIKGIGAHSGTKDLKFADIPWPVDLAGSKEESVGLADLTMERVEEFLLGTIRVRGSKVTKKERVRSSLLRWHPDKMTAVLARVVEDDVNSVQRGINSVILALQKILNAPP